MRGWYARAVVALRWPIIVAWLAGVAAAYIWLPSIQSAPTGLRELVPSDSPAAEAEERAAELFRVPVLSRIAIVQRDPDGLSPDAKRDAVARAYGLTTREYERFEDAILAAFPLVNEARVPGFTREPGTTALTYLLYAPDLGPQGQTGLSRLLIEREVEEPDDAPVGVTGAAAARAEQVGLIVDRLPWVELATVALVAGAVGLHFRALLAPLVVLLSVGMAYIGGTHVVAAIGARADLSVPREVEPVIVVLLFGIITDYSIFFLSRFRRRLSEGEDPRAAAVGTIEDLAGIVLAAGLAVMAGTASLLVADLGFFRVFGPGLALAVGVGVAASLTFLPAALAALGTAVFWPSRPGRDVPAERAREDAPEGSRPVRGRTLRWVAAHPLVATVACLALLLVAASGISHIRVGQTIIRGLPEDSEARVAYNAAKQGFAPGVLAPTVVLFERPDIADERRRLAEVQRRLERLPGVAQVVGPSDSPFRDSFGVLETTDGDAARMIVILDSDPYGARAIRQLERIERELPRALTAAGLAGATSSVIGDTAIAAEIVQGTRSDLAQVAPATLIAVGLVLVIFLRALVAPLYLLAASVLALAAALGLTVYVFQDLLGYAELTYYVPFVASVLLVALGSDYNVFLAGRVWQEARHRPVRDAVAVGGTRAATAITVAGIVLALSFALLAIVPIRPFRELAFMMFVGLLLDAFLVRTILVPALIALFGTASGWPGRSLLQRGRGEAARAPA